MRSRRSPVVKPLFPRKTTLQENKTAGSVDLSSYLSYAVLILYVLASVSSTKDEMLLIPSKGISLPLVSVTVSVVGFYLLSPLIVLVGHLVTLRRISQTFAKLSYAKPRLRHEKLNVSSDYFMFISLLCAGPVTLLLIIYRFAAYQSPTLFLIQSVALIYACYASVVRCQEVLHKAWAVIKLIKWASCIMAVMLGAWLVLAADVILAPARYSATIWLKTHTKLLDDDNGGTVGWIPHIHIDRVAPLWSGVAKGHDDFAMYTGHADAKELFMERGVALDLRSRSLRFLDISQQVVPRIWAHDADLSGANLSFTRLYGSLFIGTKLSGANFELAALDGSSFMNTMIKDTAFLNTGLKGSYWDGVVISDSVFQYSDLSLSSLYGVKINNVLIEGSDFTAASFFEVKATETMIDYKDSYKILSAKESDMLVKEFSPIFKVAPKAAFSEIANQLCRPKIDLGWKYAWANFLQLERLIMAHSDESVVASALQGLIKLEQCKGLPDRGLRKSDNSTDASGKSP